MKHTISLWQVVHWQAGAEPTGTVRGALACPQVASRTPEEMVSVDQTLDLADVYAVIAHYLRHRAAFETYLEARSAQREGIRQEIESLFPTAGLRSQLLARRQK